MHQLGQLKRFKRYFSKRIAQSNIDNDIFDKYYNWLIQHIEEKLQYDGFQRAEIAKEKNQDSLDKTNLTVRYHLDTEQNLDTYLKNNATAMRSDSIKRFGNKFSASRRVFVDPIHID